MDSVLACGLWIGYPERDGVEGRNLACSRSFVDSVIVWVQLVKYVSAVLATMSTTTSMMADTISTGSMRIDSVPQMT